MRYYLPSTRMAIIKKSKNNNCCKDVEKRETVHFGGNVNWYSHYGEQCGHASEN